VSYTSGALKFNNHFLNQIILHCIQNDDFIKKVRHTVPLDIFKTRDKKFLIEICFEFFDDFNAAPQDNFFDIFKEREKSIPSDLYDRCINLIGVLKDISGSNPEYILKTIDDAIRHFRLEEASVEFASLIKRGKYNDAKLLILKAIKDPVIEEPYYNFLEDRSFIHDRIKENRFDMSTGIDVLDATIGGYRNSWLVTVLGATKGGKTWFLIEMAVTAVFQGKRVLFISLEMGKEQIDERFDMTIGFMTSRMNGDNVEVMRKVGEDWIKSTENIDSIYNINKVVENRNRMRKIGGGDLRVVAFNRGRLNCFDVERIIDELEESGFYTDVVIVDYLGIMKETAAGQSKKERISENCIGLKDLSGRKNMIAISAMQGNRKAMTAEIFHSHLVADDIDTIFNSDLVLAFCQTKFEEEQNKYRLYIANYRHGKQHMQIGLVRDLEIGQVALDTYELKEKQDEDDKSAEAGVDY
jgi:hypothetical protein